MPLIFEVVTVEQLVRDTGADPRLARRFHEATSRMFDRAAGGNAFIVGPGWVFGLETTFDPGNAVLAALAGELEALVRSPEESSEIDLDLPTDLLGGREVWFNGDLWFTVAGELGVGEDLLADLCDAFESRLREALAHGELDHVATRPSLERELAAWIIEHLDEVSPHFVDEQGNELGSLTLVQAEHVFGDRTRADLLCRLDSGDYVVLELKAGRARIEAYEQLVGYVRLVEDELADAGQVVAGILVALGMSPECRAAVDADEQISFMTNNWLGNWSGALGTDD